MEKNTQHGICFRCGGVFRHDHCIQCGWAGERVTDRDRLLAHQRQDILDVHRLRRLEKDLLWEGAQIGLESYKQAWYHGEYDDGDLFIDQAIDYAFDQVESGRVKPDHFRNYFRKQAKKRFRELARAGLLEQEKQTHL
jgi:predicted nucleic acid-binding Zn ribbon protein